MTRRDYLRATFSRATGRRVISSTSDLACAPRWILVGYPICPATKIQAQMITGCTSNGECRVVETHPPRDHTLLVGEGIWARYDSALKPLVYDNSRYWRLGTQVPGE